ncbi:MAG TPA: hypothetical protein VGM19_08300 [Armatimonadota bacterium]|jgi:hypothetical protein
MPTTTPSPTPDWVGVSTGNAQINEAFRIAVALVDDLRAQYHAGGGTPGWLPVSSGLRGPAVHVSDTRDSAHAVKMAAYLWGEEPEQGATLEEAFFLTFVDPVTGQPKHPCSRCTAAVSLGMFLRCAADTYRYFRPGPQAAEALRRAALTVAWVEREHDPEGSGFLDNRNEEAGTFWGIHLGEPNHFPSNYDPKTKAIVPTMAYAVWLQAVLTLAEATDAPEAATFRATLSRVWEALETQAWSERYGYYFMQFDRVADKWFLSMNGLSEDSRETDIIPYYAAEMPVDPERRRCVARWLDHALVQDRVFPMPFNYPPYAWYSPDHPNYIDHGRAKSIIGGAWDTSYLHCVTLLREAGCVEALELAVRKRAEAIARDQDCIEWYHLDGTTDDATGMHRDRYLVSATAHLAATIEGLFGVTPAAPGFAEINFAPSLPLFRRHRHTRPPAPHAERDNTLRVTLPEGRRLEFTLRYSESDEILRARTNELPALGHFRLPVDLASRVREVRWAGEPLPYRIETHLGQDFVYADHQLDGGELTVIMDPHPQKGKGTTPQIKPTGTRVPDLEGDGGLRG